MGETIAGHLTTMNSRLDAMESRFYGRMDTMESTLLPISTALAALISKKPTAATVSREDSRSPDRKSPKTPVNPALNASTVVKSTAQSRDATGRLNLEQFSTPGSKD